MKYLYRFEPITGDYCRLWKAKFQRMQFFSRGVNGFDSWYDDSLEMANLRGITLRYHPGSEKPYRLKLYTQGWVFCIIFEEAINRAWDDLNGETLITALESFKDFKTGLCPPLTFGPNRRKATDYQRLFKVDIEKGILCLLQIG